MSDMRYPQVNQSAADVADGVRLIKMIIAECNKQAQESPDDQTRAFWSLLSSNSQKALQRLEELQISGQEGAIWSLLWHFGIRQK